MVYAVFCHLGIRLYCQSQAVVPTYLNMASKDFPLAEGGSGSMNVATFNEG